MTISQLYFRLFQHFHQRSRLPNFQPVVISNPQPMPPPRTYVRITRQPISIFPVPPSVRVHVRPYQAVPLAPTATATSPTTRPLPPIATIRPSLQRFQPQQQQQQPQQTTSFPTPVNFTPR